MNKARISAVRSGLLSSVSGYSKPYDNGEAPAGLVLTCTQVSANSDDIQSTKRMKIENMSQSLVPESECADATVSVVSETPLSQDVRQVDQQVESCVPVKSEFNEVKMEDPQSSAQESFGEFKDNAIDIGSEQAEGKSSTCNDPIILSKKESPKVEKVDEAAKQESGTHAVENVTGTKSGKPKVKGVSLTELFTPEQVREHIQGLRRWVGQVNDRTLLFL